MISGLKPNMAAISGSARAASTSVSAYYSKKFIKLLLASRQKYGLIYRSIGLISITAASLSRVSKIF